LCPISAWAKNRILYIDSYHAGYDWSDGITDAIKSVLQPKDVELKIFRMDTKRNADEAFKKKAALEAKALIEAFNPAVVIASDDNASKYLIQPYYKNAKLPFVFCGVNHSGEAYGYPYDNVTGMVEVSPIPKLIYSLKHFNRSEKVALLIGDSLTDHKDAESYAGMIDLPFDRIHVGDFERWKAEYIRLQDQYDIMIVGNNASVRGWDADAALKVVMSKTKIPTGCDLDFMAPFSFLGYTKVAQEQGRWAAQTALRIIDGTSPAEIPMTKNVEGNLIVNLKVATALGIKVPKSLLRKAGKIIE
jgi:ABC-type uncharacterized transport system substrate-binding protein